MIKNANIKFCLQIPCFKALNKENVQKAQQVEEHAPQEINQTSPASTSSVLPYTQSEHFVAVKPPHHLGNLRLLDKCHTTDAPPTQQSSRTQSEQIPPEQEKQHLGAFEHSSFRASSSTEVPSSENNLKTGEFLLYVLTRGTIFNCINFYKNRGSDFT